MGFRVGLINYPRFPTTSEMLWAKAEELANLLKAGCNQGSFTIQDATVSIFYSTRDQDQ